MNPSIDALRVDLIAAGRILVAHDILDAFGHVSVRDPDNPARFWMTRARAPALATPDDVMAFDLDGAPVDKGGPRAFAERVIHARLYRSRPDVMAVCHHHAPAVLPFCVTGVALVPVVHLGATMGPVVPFWDARDEFGDTNLLVTSIAEADSLARALGANSLVLMRRHGATAVGSTLPQLVFRTVYSAHNARVQLQAMALGKVDVLTEGERAASEAVNLSPLALDRAWEVWNALHVGDVHAPMTAAGAPRALAPATTTAVSAGR